MAWSQRKKLAWLFLLPLAMVMAGLSPFALPPLLTFISLEPIEQKYPDGSPKLRHTVHRWGPLAHIAHGRWTEFYPGSGKRLEKYYTDGKLNGITTEWNMQGEIFAQYRYELGKLVGVKMESPWFTGHARPAADLDHGRFVEHDPATGHKIREYSYVRGASHGIWTTWNVDGKVIAQQRYNRGKLEEERFSAPWIPGVLADQASSQSR